MKFKVIIVLLIMSVFTCNFGYAQLEGTHVWTDATYFGGSAGVYSFDQEGDGFFANIMGYYHNSLEHINPHGGLNHNINLGILGAASYFRDPKSDFSATLQLSTGLWLNKYTLMQLSAGPVWSDTVGIGGSSILMISTDFTNQGSIMVGRDEIINAAAVFIRADRYTSDILFSKWRISLGISFGFTQIIKN